MNSFTKVSAMLALSFMVIQGCKKDKNNEPNPIVGKWDWIITYGNTLIPKVTPDLAGFNLTYKFDNDSVQLYLDSTLYSVGKYSVTTLSNGDGTSFSELTFNWTTPAMIQNAYMKKIIGTCKTANYQISNDTIIINYSECDIRSTKTEKLIRKRE